MSDQPFRDEDVVFRLSLEHMDKRDRTIANVPMEYVVFKCSDNPSGITTVGRYSDDRWDSPWHDLPVIAELIRQRQELEEKCKRLLDAFYEAINRPKGVVPAGYCDLYDQALARQEKGGGE